MRKYLRNIARNSLRLMDAPNKSMSKMWRKVLFGDLAQKAFDNQMAHGRKKVQDRESRKAMKARKLRRIEANE